MLNNLLKEDLKAISLAALRLEKIRQERKEILEELDLAERQAEEDLAQALRDAELKNEGTVPRVFDVSDKEWSRRRARKAP